MCDEQALEAMFKQFDADGSNFVDQGELEKIFTAVAEDGKCGITQEDISNACAFMVKAADKNADGKISLDEFKKFTKEFVDQK